jgi:hypothetical protein
MRNKKRTIRYATDIGAYNSPLIPTRNVIPDWYKNTPKHAPDANPNKIPNSKSFKACTPFLEAFTLGYVLTTPCDIAVDNLTDIETVITWNETLGYRPVSLRTDTELNKLLPIPEAFSPQQFVWATKVCYEIPEGYSALITHPINRHDLPFSTLGAVIDGRMLMHFGNIPVFFKKSFNGIIPKGTPYAQIIPFKREDWYSIKDQSILEEEKENTWSARATTKNWYKMTHWRKKTYN